MATVIIVLDLRHEEDWGNKVVVYNLIFFVTLIGALVYFIVGLLAANPVPAFLQHAPLTHERRRALCVGCRRESVLVWSAQ